MKWLRSLLLVILLLFVVGVLVIAALMWFVDPNKLKPALVEEVKKRTGYTLNMAGQLAWSIYPTLGVRIDHATLVAPGQTAAFADLKDVTIATSPSQWLMGHETLKGDIHIAALQFMNMKAERVYVGLDWQDNVLTLQPISAALYDGHMTGTFHGRNFETVPQWDGNIQLDKVQIKPLLQDLHGVGKLTLSGALQLSMQMQLQGATKDALLRSMSGDGEFSIDHSALEGIDINYWVQAAQALLRQQANTAVQTNQTVFDHMAGTLFMKNGVLTTNNFLLTSSVFAVKAIGDIDLPNATLDYQLDVMPMNMDKLRFGVPLLVSGSIYDPSIKLDDMKLKMIIANDQFDKVKTKVKEQVKKLPEKADKLLKKLLGH